MAISITDENINACWDRMKADPDGITCDDDYDKNILLYLLLSSIVMDYLKETGLKESAELHKSISGNLAKLADLITWRNYQIDNVKYSECISKGVIPIDAGHVTFGADNGTYEMPKQVFDTIIKSTTNMMMIIFCAMIRHEKISYDELCQWVIKDLVT